jgi:hypothetical protein
MSLRAELSSFLFVPFALACLLFLPAAAAAATPDPDQDQKAAATGLEFRFEHSAYGVPALQTEAIESESLSKLSIRLYGAYSYIGAADVNEGSDGLFELFALYEALGFGTTEGGYNPVHGGYNFGGDLIYQISPRIGIGIGAGYMKYSRSSLMSVTADTLSLTLSGTPMLSAVPIRLGVFLNFPVAPRLDMIVNAGGAYYAGLKFEAGERIEADGDWQAMSLTGSRSSLANLGVQGGIGFEYRISPKIGFFVEAEGRYARFKNFDSVTSAYESSDGASGSETGKLYIDTYSYPDGTYSEFYVNTTPPVDTEYETFREPKFDLSGFSLQAGFRFRF